MKLDKSHGQRLIQVATEREWARLRSLFEEYAATLGFDLEFQDFEGELRTLSREYGPPDGEALLAYVHGAVAGCVARRRLAPGICEMKRLYVRPAYRGRGLGRALAESIVSSARLAGYERMRLDTLASMTAANTLYASLGFAITAAYRYNPIEGARYFELDLTSGRRVR